MAARCKPVRITDYSDQLEIIAALDWETTRLPITYLE